MLLDPSTTSYVAVAGAALGVLGLGAGLGSALRIRRVRRAYAGVSEAAESGNLLTQIAGQQQEIEALRASVTTLGNGLAAARTDLADSLRHVAVVRYDAFADMGGRMSFSAALLDDAGDGLVLTAINGRSEARSYAKGVKAGASEAPLSPEELQAIGYAQRGAPVAGSREGRDAAPGRAAVR